MMGTTIVDPQTHPTWIRLALPYRAPMKRSMAMTRRVSISERKKEKPLFNKDFSFGGLYWTRTSDPIDVNDVLYQLSQQTTTPSDSLLHQSHDNSDAKNFQKRVYYNDL